MDKSNLTNGMANCLAGTFVLKQQTLPAWECNNASSLYLATHGRGLWNANDLQPKVFSTAVPIVKADVNQNSLLVYPKPNDHGRQCFFPILPMQIM